MKDIFEAIANIRRLIAVPEIEQALKAKVYSNFMPPGLNEPSIVVKSLFLKNRQIQTGVFLINIHLPTIKAYGDKPYPDLISFSALERALTQLLDERYEYSFQCWVDEVLPVNRDTDGSYYQTIRIEYNSINTNYTNI